MRKISASDAAKLAALRAQVHELEVARLREETAERKARARRQNTIMAVAASAVVTLVLTTGITYVATAPTVVWAPFSTKEKPDDRRFNETREGIVRYAEGERRQCRQIDFNNTSGRFSNETQVACYDPKTQDIGSRLPQSQVGDAFDQMRNSFRAR